MIRLFVPDDLTEGGTVALGSDQTHYLGHVMRLAAGAELRLFNGRDGEWRACVKLATRRAMTLRLLDLARPQTPGPDLDLVVALVKRGRLETIVEKAAELGARRILTVTTERTNAGHANVERLGAIAIEAAEQTGRLDVPDVLAPRRLSALLADWPTGRRLMFCDEAGDATAAAQVLAGLSSGPWAILVGPEGGFSADERAAIRALPAAVPVGLGPRILRADTAAISALTLWQATLGDWR